jgi:hypothetical protein
LSWAAEKLEGTLGKAKYALFKVDGCHEKPKSVVPKLETSHEKLYYGRPKPLWRRSEEV